MGSPAGRTALIITADAECEARLARVVAAVGATARRIDPSGADALPARAGLIFVDADQLEFLVARAPLPAPVIVVSAGEMTATQWQSSLDLAVRRVHQLTDPDEDLVREAAAILSEAIPDGRMRASGQVLACIGGRGGAGSSSLATATAAIAQRRGDHIVLCDMDRFGAGLNLLTGLGRTTGTGWADLDMAAVGSGGATGGLWPTARGEASPWAGALADALPTVPGGPGRWSLLGFGPGPRAPIAPATAASVAAALRDCGLLAVMDLPRTFDDAVLAAVARADLTVILTTADVRGCYSAAQVAAELHGLGSPLALVVRGPAPTGLAATEIARSIGLPLITAMRPQPHLDRDLDCGRIPGSRSGPLAQAAGRVLNHLRGLR